MQGFATSATMMMPFGGAANTTTRVFWSGGNATKNAAASFAKANGMKTLEMTILGRLMNVTSSYLPRSISNPFWRMLSKNFAKSARGEAHFVTTTAGPRAGSIWLKIEKPILQNNAVKIVTH